MNNKLKGGCLCESVTYQCSSEPEATMLCHCLECQKWTGSSYATMCLFEDKNISITGKLKEFKVTTDSGNLMSKFFCPECGTHIFESSAWLPNYTALAAGSLNDQSLIKPSAQCWTKRMLPWVKETHELPAFEENPPINP